MVVKHFFKGLTWLLLLNLLVKPVWIFAIDRQVQNTVGNAAYGSYFSLFNLTYVLLFIADAGLTNMLTQKLAAKHAVPIPQLLQLKLLLLCVYALACAGIGWLAGVQQFKNLVLLVALQSLGSLFLFLRGFLTAQQLFKKDAFYSVLDKLLVILLCAAPLYGFFAAITIELFIWLQLTATATALLFLIWALRKTIFERVVAKEKSLVVLRWMAPFATVILLMSVHYRVDGFILERLHGDGAVQAGLYARAYRLLDAANMIGYLTASFLVPFIANNKNDANLVSSVLLTARRGLLFIAAMLIGFTLAAAPWIQSVLYYTTDVASLQILCFSMLVLPAYYLVHIYGSALTAMGYLTLFIRILLFFAGLNLLLNVWLAPQYGAIACSLVAILTQYGCAFSLMMATRQKLFTPFAWKHFLQFVFMGVAMWLIIYYGQKLVTDVWIILAGLLLSFIVLLVMNGQRIKNAFTSFNK